ncbi:MAG: hypothetical protein QMD08_08290 [Actinomycetota bacterium]|nr:hypothetical protein [Actinomycetota bacterium]
MGFAEDIQNFVHNIIDSYEMRVKTVTALMRQTNELLKSFRLEQEEMIVELRERLAKSECLRRGDFDAMMESIRTQQRERERQVSQMLEKFHREEHEMVAGLREILVSNKWTRLQDFRVIKENILTRQKEREREVSDILRSFHLEQEELYTGLKKLLSKNESVKIKDFKAMIKSIQAVRKERESEVGKMLEDLREVHEEVSGQWQKVMNTMKKRRFTQITAD